MRKRSGPHPGSEQIGRDGGVVEDIPRGRHHLPSTTVAKQESDLTWLTVAKPSDIFSRDADNLKNLSILRCRLNFKNYSMTHMKYCYRRTPWFWP